MPRLKVNEENLLDLLTTKLYSTDPNLTIRELLQNASDAINEAPDNSKHAIDVEFDGLATDRRISVIDTGIGMNDHDLENRLAVVADGDKIARAKDNDAIAGRFGIGFLSTLIIADEVEVLTRKAGEDQGWRFLLKKSGEYSIEPTDKQVVQGTKVTLHVGDSRDRSRELVDKISDLLTEEGMNDAIREWGYLLKFPVRLKSSSGRKQINARTMPWDDDQAAAAAFEDVFGKDSRPVFTWRFGDRTQSGVSFSGVFYFNDSLIYKPTARLYSRGLLVDAENSALMPDYSGFAYCLVECSQVEVDLARRNAEQDQTFRSLSNAIWYEFTKAFCEFATRYTNEMINLWAAVDNTTTSALLRLLDTSAERLSDRRAAATDFLIRAAADIPFYTLDEISGAQGRPQWKTIRELVADKVNDLDSSYRPGEIIELPYTDSTVPVEKDILISEHGVLIDVSREEKNHGALLLFFQRHIDDVSARHGFRLLPATLPEPDDVTADEVRRLWQPALDVIQKSIRFYQREHEVVVERIRPKDTPVIVGLEEIDDNLVNSLRDQLKELGMAGPQSAALVQKLDGVLKGAGGSKIRVRVNADNGTMHALAKATIDEATLRDAEIALQTIVWRAVLDFFGTSATRQMIAEERANVNRMVATLLNRAERLSESQRQESESSAELAAAKKRLDELSAEIGRLRSSEVAAEPEARPPQERIVGVLDIQNSTRSIFGIGAQGPEAKASVLDKLVKGISAKLDAFAEVTGFTGDGIQFIVRDDLDDQACIRAGNLLIGLSDQVMTVVADDSELDNFFRSYGVGVPKLRVSIDWGEVYEAKIAGRIEAYGQPFIRATRIVTDKSIYEQRGVSILLSRWAFTKGVRLWDVTRFEEAGSVRVAGLNPEDVPVYAPKA